VQLSSEAVQIAITSRQRVCAAAVRMGRDSFWGKSRHSYETIAEYPEKVFV